MIQPSLRVSLHELCQLDGIEGDVIIEIVEYGIAQPVAGSDASNWIFETTSVHWIKKAVRLHQDLEIDWVAVALLIDLMRQKETLQKENRDYQRQLRRFIAEL